jgi:hypothetical protein
MHALLDLRGNIPTFIRVTTGDVHDVNILDEIVSQPGAYYVMDRGYLDYARLYRIHLAGAFLVTRAKRNLDASRIYSQQVDKQTGILADQSIALNGYDSRKDYPSHLRRIRYRDPDTGKDLVFLANQFTLPAATICALYKSRWQVELFFENTTWCTPPYVIESQRATWLNPPLVGVLPDFLTPCIARRSFSAVSMVRSHRFAWPVIASAESAERWLLV